MQNKQIKNKNKNNNIKNDWALSAVYTPKIPGFSRFEITPFPTTLRTKLPYVSARTLTTGTTAWQCAGSNVININDLYNPEAVGHQPYGYDTLCAAGGPYTKFKVYGFRAKIHLSALPGNEAIPGVYVLTKLTNITDNFSLGGQTIEVALEKPTVRKDWVPQTGHQSTSFEVNVPEMAALFNWSREQFHADTLSSMGAYGASPTSRPLLELAACANDNVAISVSVVIEAEFDVVFLERQTLVQS